MTENKFIFNYINAYFNKALQYLDKNSIIYLSGEPKIGKTYLAELCMGKVLDSEYYKLHLKVYDGYNPSYYTFQLGLMQSDALYETGKEIATEIINNSNIKSLKAIGEIIDYCSSYNQRNFSHLNESEISIINRISLHCKNRSLFLVVDDYDKWDGASKNLLAFFMTPEAQNRISFLKKGKIIIVGENQSNFEILKTQFKNIKSINIEGYRFKEPFVEEFIKVIYDSVSLAETLYEITKGNMGMAYELGLYMEENALIESISSQMSELKAKKIFLSIIDNRVHSINETTPYFANTMKAASIQGAIFNHKYLPEIIGENEFTIERLLALAQQERFLNIVKSNEILYSFISDYVYQYFNEHYNEYRKEFHYKFASAAKKIHPSDYYTQYLHLRAAGKEYEAAENLVIHLTCQKLKNDITDSILENYLKDSSEDLYSNYIIISESIEKFHHGAYKDALAKLELITPISEIVFFEKDYLAAYFIYDGWIHEQNSEACGILTNNFDNLLDSNFDMWLRSGLLLYILYVNRLGDSVAARDIEKKIMKEISKRYRNDSSLEIIVQILNRNASAIYSTEIALQKAKNSVDYFTNCAHTLPQEYIYALTNYSGLLFCASEYEQGFEYAQKAVDFLLDKKIWIKDLRKVVNNYIICGVMSQAINYSEALEMCISLKDSVPNKNILIENNYYVFRVLLGNYKGLLEEIEKLFWSDSVQKHNDYYIYLIGINYICISLIMGQPCAAQKIYDTLNEMIPAICSREEYIIKRRYSIYKGILENENLTFKNLHSLEEYFNLNLSDIDSDYAKKPYILTDQQFWSVL